MKVTALIELLHRVDINRQLYVLISVLLYSIVTVRTPVDILSAKIHSTSDEEDTECSAKNKTMRYFNTYTG